MTTPASSSNINVPNSSANSNSIHANVIPSEVGWQFVPQYYTFVNKQPHRLHCFYTKNSTFIHGTEGEDGRPCYGQQEIHNKILSIGFQDCKVFIHSVDAQSSANGGIIIQVIGEMSNRGEPWRKFAQTFFLAEQPNGYFVLNDIFRFLKEESVEADDDESSEHTNSAQPEPAPAPVVEPAAAQVAQENLDAPAAPAVQAAHPTVAAAPFDAALPEHLQSAAAVPTELVEPAEPAPPAPVVEGKKTPQPNGIHPPAAPDPEPAPAAPQAEPAKQEASPSPALMVEPPARSATPPAPVAATAPVQLPVAAPASLPSPAITSKPAPTPSPKPVAQPAPKTWANLAAANSNKWGPQVAQEARGVSAAPPAPAPVPKTEATPRAAPGAAEKDARDGNSRELHPAHQAAISVATPQCFVKSVTEVISHAALSGTLTTRFGPIKELEIVRSKACAFLEFTTLDAARRAIVASLPVAAGGEGGVRIELDGGGSARISVETRKERGDRPPPRPRSGVPPGQERGAFRGGPGRGRGGAPGRGGASAGAGTAGKP